MKLYTLMLTFVLASVTPAWAAAQDDDYSFDEFATEGEGEGEGEEEEVAADEGGDDTTELEATDTSDDGEADDSSSDDGEETTEDGEAFESEDSVGRPLADRIKAVSRKFFLKKNRFELTPAFGLSVNDAFFRNYILQLDATYHIMEPFAVELRVGGAFAGEPLEPVSFLRDEFKVLTGLVRPIYLADISGTFTPLYGKTSLFSDWIWHYDMYVAGGLGVTGVSILSGTRLDISAIAHQPTLNVGGGMRGFVTKWMVVHVDVRDYIYPSVTDGLSNIQNLLVLSIGAGFYFPFDFEYEYDGYKVES